MVFAFLALLAVQSRFPWRYQVARYRPGYCASGFLELRVQNTSTIVSKLQTHLLNCSLYGTAQRWHAFMSAFTIVPNIAKSSESH
jgi:hypothetical protein